MTVEPEDEEPERIDLPDRICGLLVDAALKHPEFNARIAGYLEGAGRDDIAWLLVVKSAYLERTEGP
jgi:hypothetical protein